MDRVQLRQLRLHHLLGLITALAVMLAAYVPLLREYKWQVQASVGIQTAIVGSVLFIMLIERSWRRRRLVAQAGRLLARFTTPTSLRIRALVSFAIVAIYVLESIWRIAIAASDDSVAFIPVSPMVLVFGSQYLILRVWWNIDPRGIEAFDVGLCIGAFTLFRWDAIHRWSFTGAPPHQLNLFLTSQHVVNFRINPATSAALAEILQAHVSPGVLSEAVAVEAQIH